VKIQTSDLSIAVATFRSLTPKQSFLHFALTPQLWPVPRWIRFANSQRECSTHFADFGPIIGRVAILDNAPDTLISVAVLCRKGLEVSFKIPGGPGIYLHGALVHQGIVDKTNDMFYVNIRDLLETSIRFQFPEAFQRYDTSEPEFEPADKNCYGTTRRHGITAEKIRKVLWFHKRLGHPSRETMVHAIMSHMWTGMSDDITAVDINATFTATQCTACQLSKSNRLPRGKGSGTHPEFPGQVLAVDYQGLITPTSVRGYTGFFLFKCLHSAYRHVILTRDKSADSFNMALARVIDFYNVYGHVTKKIRFDAGSTENSEASADWLTAHRIEVDPAAPECQFQNPLEREVQTLNKGVAALLIDQSALGPSFWCCCRIVGTYCKLHYWSIR
jgi:hypothetical protein